MIPLDTQSCHSDGSLLGEVCVTNNKSARPNGEYQSVTSENGIDVARWANELELVRREKSIEAFELLFNHFAPKVKGFDEIGNRQRHGGRMRSRGDGHRLAQGASV